MRTFQLRLVRGSPHCFGRMFKQGPLIFNNSSLGFITYRARKMHLLRIFCVPIQYHGSFISDEISWSLWWKNGPLYPLFYTPSWFILWSLLALGFGKGWFFSQLNHYRRQLSINIFGLVVIQKWWSSLYRSLATLALILLISSHVFLHGYTYPPAAALYATATVKHDPPQ